MMTSQNLHGLCLELAFRLENDCQCIPDVWFSALFYGKRACCDAVNLRLGIGQRNKAYA